MIPDVRLCDIQQVSRSFLCTISRPRAHYFLHRLEIFCTVQFRKAPRSTPKSSVSYGAGLSEWQADGDDPSAYELEKCVRHKYTTASNEYVATAPSPLPHVRLLRKAA